MRVRAIFPDQEGRLVPGLFARIRVQSGKAAPAILIDDKLLYLGGTNLNRRSFLHDIEGGLLVTGRAPIAKFNEIYDNVYLPGSERQQAPFSAPLWNSVVDRILGNLF